MNSKTLPKVVQHLTRRGELRDPASPEKLAALEALVGSKLPDDYRAFLELANGFEEPISGVAVVPVEEVLGDEHGDVLEEVREEASAQGFTACHPVAFVMDEDTALCLVVENGKATIREAHQACFDEPVSFTAWIGRLAED